MNAWYITAYEPIFNNDNKVIGVLYVGVPEESAKSLRKQIMKIKIGKTGDVWVINSKGKYVISKQGKRDGENIWEQKDSNGHLFIQSIIKKAQGMPPGNIAVEHYPWENPKDIKSRMKIAYFIYFKPWDWIIGAGSYENEFKAAENRICGEAQKTQCTIIIVFIASLFASLILWWIVPGLIARPIQRAADMLKDISEGEGDLTRRLDVQTNDEIDRMAKHFNNFIKKLEGIISQIANNAESLATTSEEMAAVSTQLLSGAEEMNSQAMTIAGATEQMSANIKSVDEAVNLMNKNARNVSKATGQIAENMNKVASATEESQTNVSSMATASQEMNTTINEIAQNAQTANETTLNAVESVKLASDQVSRISRDQPDNKRDYGHSRTNQASGLECHD